jgi:prevent-host-death family protein
MATWQVQEAKTRLSEVIERARTEGPQTITRHGAARAVVLQSRTTMRWRPISRTSRPIC